MKNDKDDLKDLYNSLSKHDQMFLDGLADKLKKSRFEIVKMIISSFRKTATKFSKYDKYFGE